MRIACLVVFALLSLAASSVPALADPVAAARQLIEDGRHQQAIDRLKPVPDSVEREILLSRAFNGLGQHSEAVDRAKAATKRSPDNAHAHLAHAIAMRDKMLNGGRLAAIRSIGSYKKSLRKALELAPDDVEVREEEIGYLLVAPGFAGGDKERALERARELSRLDPERGRINQISALLTLQRDDEGFALMREHLADDPEADGVRWRLAMLLQGRERYEEADAEFETLARDAERDDLRYGAVYQMGRSRVLGQYDLDRAVELFARYIDEAADAGVDAPSAAAAHWRTGMAHEAAGRPDRARASYEQALRLEPDNSAARKSLKQLNRKKR